MNRTKIMGILNVTNNSFSDGGKYLELDQAIQHGINLAMQGADIIDVGGESTKPGAEEVSLQTELDRVIPVIKALKKEISIPISIDTMKAEVAEAAINAGASWINDVSGFRDQKMVEVAAKYQVMICCMHMQGTPRTMQLSPHYPEGIISHLLTWGKTITQHLMNNGISQKKIILDPGIGFGKTIDDNLKILHNLPQLSNIGFPLLIGASRKTFIGNILNKPPEDRLSGSIAAHIMAALGGAEYIRVHDVIEHKDALEISYRIRTI